MSGYVPSFASSKTRLHSDAESGCARAGTPKVRTVTEYLLKAVEFDGLAETAPDPLFKRRYTDLADCYRLLAGDRKQLLTPGTNRATWRIGQRVARKDTKELGTVTETDGKIKVKWDTGATSD